MKYLTTLFIFFVSTASAQLLDGHQKHFTQADTLRGALRPERTCYDVQKYDLNLQLNIDHKTISGSNKIYFESKADFKRLQIDLFRNMQIDSIKHQNTTLPYERLHNAVFVDFPKEIKKGEKEMIEVFYNGKPTIAKNAPWDGGFSWAKDKNGKDWVAVSCEGVGASLWFPNKDHLADEPETVRISCTTPKDLQFVSNGILKANKVEGNQRTMTWETSYPINNYNITLNVGDYINFQDKYYSIEDSTALVLDYWVLRGNKTKAEKHFKQVQPMLACFEHYFGKFPFWKDNYKLVETPYAGMEHQTAIAYGNQFKTGYGGNDYSRIGLDFDYIIIHETGHEYWGNLISATDMADLWIHEGFCTYSEALYVECLYGYDKAQEYINAKKPSISNTESILGTPNVNAEGSADMYNKGMLFLNTLRHTINNDSLWFSILKDMTTKDFAHQTTNTEAIIQYFNRKTAMNLRPLFQQYLAYANLPKLYLSYKELKGNEVKINYRWLTDVEGFEMPLVFQVGKQNYRLKATNTMQSFVFKRKKKQLIEIDKASFYYELLFSDLLR